jgi:hypothetical protein
VRDIPVPLSYAPAIPTQRVVVHAGRLVDGVSATPRTNVDIIISGNRIQRVVPHAAANLVGARVVGAS